MPNILRIDTSARRTGSITRDLTDRVVAHLGGIITTRDLTTALPQIDETWVAANFTAADQRNDEQRTTLALSDTLISELNAADTVVIGVPIYNFSVPAALKAWIDLIARAGVTFKYAENGPVGLLENKRAILVVASGGVPAGSEMDFATGYLRHVLGFVGITDVQIIAADQMAQNPEQTLANAHTAITKLAKAA